MSTRAQLMKLASYRLEKRAGGYAEELFHHVMGGAKGVNMGRAATEGGLGGAAAGLGVLGHKTHGLMNLAPEAQKGLIEKFHGHEKTLAEGGKLSAAEQAEHAEGKMMHGIDTHFMKSNGIEYDPLHRQILHNFGGVKNALGDEAVNRALKGAALGTAAHAAGQTAGQAMISHKASKYLIPAAGAAALGGYALSRD